VGIIHWILVAPLFMALPFGLTRPRGQRFLAGVGIYLMWVAAWTVLISIMLLANIIILSILCGPRAAISREVWMVGDRNSINLSNGEHYGGFWVFLRGVAAFATMCTVGYCLMRTGRWTYSRSTIVQRVVARFAQAIESKRAR